MELSLLVLTRLRFEHPKFRLRGERLTHCTAAAVLLTVRDHIYVTEIEYREAYCFCPPLWNFNLANNFGTVSARALIFHMSIPCDKTFPQVPLFFTL